MTSKTTAGRDEGGMLQQEGHEDPTPEGGLAAIPRRVEYHVALTPKEVIEHISSAREIGAYRVDELPSWTDPNTGHGFTMEIEPAKGEDLLDEFRVHVGPPAARGQSGTGLLKLLYLAGRLERTPAGTKVKLRFVYGRPTWAGQRRIGFLALLLFAGLWVFLGSGAMMPRVMLFGAFVLATAPVVLHDLRRGKQVQIEKRALLALFERTLGAGALGPSEGPYRE